MAGNNSGLPPLSPESVSQLIFGGFLIFILLLAGFSLPLSIFVGIIAGFVLGWFTNSSNIQPEQTTIASTEGIDAGLKYWLFFVLGFLFFGYPAPVSILLGAIAALGGGWITAWWGCKESMQSQLPMEALEIDINQSPRERITRRLRRRPTRRYRRPSGSFNFRFWER